MLDTQMIQTRGFRNNADGFQVRLRLPYYRGVWTNLLVGAAIAVDDEAFPADSINWRIGDSSFSLAELHESSDARWPVDVPALLTVPRAEPLAIGFHTVAAELRLSMSYIPEELQPTVWTEQRRLVITQ
jgi:hypothetical protein